MTCVNKSAGQETFACTIHQIFIKGNKSHKKNDFGIIFSKELTFLAKISLYKAGPRHCWHRKLIRLFTQPLLSHSSHSRTVSGFAAEEVGRQQQRRHGRRRGPRAGRRRDREARAGARGHGVRPRGGGGGGREGAGAAVARAGDPPRHGGGAADRIHVHGDRHEDRAHHGAGAHAERLRGAHRLPRAPRVDARAAAPRRRAPPLHAPGELRHRDLRRRVLHHRVRRSAALLCSAQLCSAQRAAARPLRPGRIVD